MTTDPDTTVLRVAGRPVGRYLTRPDVPARLSPRPCLHPVTTLAGREVTELTPADHTHHLGAGVAVPDVEGHNFWGGRTYVRDRGPTELDNHGVQRHVGFQLRDPDGFVEELSWVVNGGGAVAVSGGDGTRPGDPARPADSATSSAHISRTLPTTTELLRERRTVATIELTDTAWALDFTFSLTNPGPHPLSIGSPATNGRPGAAYGGFFWRARKESSAPDVFTRDAEGETAVHGMRADWLALAGADWTLVFAGATDRTRRDPWFVRTAEYPGVGSSLASTERLPVPPGETVVRRIVTVVADGRLGRDEASALVRKAVGR